MRSPIGCAYGPDVPLVVGVPRERKDGEHRVAITPDGVHELTVHGATVVIERDAGAGSSITDDDYRAAGAEIVATAADVWARAELVMKVKEPQPEELDLLRPGLVLFTYLHLAAYPRSPTPCSTTASPASPTRRCRLSRARCRCSRP